MSGERQCGAYRLRAALAVLIIAMVMINQAWGQETAPDGDMQRRLDLALSKYHCAVANLLAEMRSGPLTSSDRFLILSPRHRLAFYVQCVFDNDDQDLLCEAASGFFDEGVKNFLTAKKLAVLAGLGFSTDASNDNFKMRKTFDGTPDIDALATFYIETLVRVYDFSEVEELRFTAPLITEEHNRPVEVPTDCLSVSSLMPPLRSSS
jgi:hypothetical protein